MTRWYAGMAVLVIGSGVGAGHLDAQWKSASLSTGGRICSLVGVGGYVNDVRDVYLDKDVLVLGDLRLSTVPDTRPFRVPCMTPSAYGSVLHRPYRAVRQCCWYHSVDWHEATVVAGDAVQRALTQLALPKGPRPVLGVVIEEHLPQGFPRYLKQAVVGLAWEHPIIASTEAITDGVHRLTAMRHQGVKSTPALLPARAGQWLSEIPGAYPHQHLG